MALHHTWLPKSRYSMQTGSYKFSLGAPTALDKLSAGNSQIRSFPHKVKADKSHQTVLCPIATMNNSPPKKVIAYKIKMEQRLAQSQYLVIPTSFLII